MYDEKHSLMSKVLTCALFLTILFVIASGLATLIRENKSSETKIFDNFEVPNPVVDDAQER